ncbi:hypothetical protein ACIPX0_26440 [Streptomyces sp. NPDC090075]|uniref:hypothetical protein n=1 Tax=Streptomyces sp. NPDC090075 TaxID=3365937 RepID=UPI00382665E5
MATAVFPAHRAIYLGALRQARRISERIADATSAPEEMPHEARYFITDDFRSGFGVTHDGTFIGLFSLVKGRGGDLVEAAITQGGRKLDCFDGFLPDYYRQFGFVETERVANWTAGEPDVVFMAIPF